MKKSEKFRSLKPVFLLVILILASSIVSAEGFGVYTSEKTQTMSEKTAEFEMLVVNTEGAEELQLSASKVQDGSVWIEKGDISREISGSSATVSIGKSVPTYSGENIVQLNSDTFVNATSIDIAFEAGEREREKYSFQVELSQEIEAADESEIAQDIVNLRSYTYTVLNSEEESSVDDSTDISQRKEDNGGGGGMLNDLKQKLGDIVDLEFESESQQDEEVGEEMAEVTEKEQEKSSSPATGTSLEGSEADGGIGTLTYVLAGGVFLSVIYLLKVM